MKEAHWVLLAVTGVLFLILLCFSLLSTAHGKGYRWTIHVLFAAAALWISGLFGGAGLNGITLLVSSVLGLPGFAALTVIHIL